MTAMNSPTDEPDIVNAMTIDVEEHFQVSVFDGLVPRADWDRMESRVCANTERLLGILADAEVQATFFVLGWVGERHPTLVRTIAAGGHEVASHGYAHRLIYDQTPAAFRDDVRRAKLLLENVIGQPVVGYRAPSYSITPRSLWALDILMEEGYEYDSSVFPITHDRYGIPVSARHPYAITRGGRSLIEVPASTVRRGPFNFPVAGGGYFRILPYGWTRAGVARLNTLERRPAVFYIHPWEIDADQPRLAASRLGRFRHYCNLQKTEARLRQLLTDFRFGTMSNLIGALPVVRMTGRSLTAPLPYNW